MSRLTSLALIALCALVGCGQPLPGTLTVRLEADPALASPFTTEDGWSLTFTHVAIGVAAVAVTSDEVNGLPSGLAKSKLVDVVKQARTDLATNTSAEPRTYDTLSLTTGRGTGEENVNVDTVVLDRMGTRPLYVEGTATRQSTMREFRLGVPLAATHGSCTPAVAVTSQASATVDFRVVAQRLFADDTGKLRFDAWARADTAPVDDIVINTEAASVMTSSLPAADYGATTGSLQTVLEKRALSLVAVGDTGACTGTR